MGGEQVAIVGFIRDKANDEQRATIEYAQTWDLAISLIGTFPAFTKQGLEQMMAEIRRLVRKIGSVPALYTSIDDLTKACESLRIERATLTEERDRLRAEVQESKSVADLTQERDQWRREYYEAKWALERMARELDTARRQFDSASGRARDYWHRIAQLNDEMDRLREQLAIAQNDPGSVLPALNRAWEELVKLWIAFVSLLKGVATRDGQLLNTKRIEDWLEWRNMLQDARVRSEIAKEIEVYALDSRDDQLA